MTQKSVPPGSARTTAPQVLPRDDGSPLHRGLRPQLLQALRRDLVGQKTVLARNPVRPEQAKEAVAGGGVEGQPIRAPQERIVAGQGQLHRAQPDLHLRALRLQRAAALRVGQPVIRHARPRQ